jgi:hypothetical protein
MRVREDEKDEAEPEASSSEHEQRQRGGTTAEEGGGGELHDARMLQRGRELESGVERCGVAGRWSSPFYRGRGAPGRRLPGSNSRR